MPKKSPTITALEQQRDVLLSERQGYNNEIAKVDAKIAIMDEVIDTVRKSIAKRKRTPKPAPTPATTAAA